MIVETMSIEEVSRAVLKTASCNSERFDKVVSHRVKGYKKVIFNGNKQCYYFKPIKVKADGIEFYVCPFCFGKSDYKKNGITCKVFSHFYYKGTNWYCISNSEFTTLQMFRQHFFERYIERHLKDGSRVSIDTVRRYLKETDKCTICLTTDNPKHPNGIYGASNIGVCCGYSCGKDISVWLTYIDKETLTKGEKKELFDITEDIKNTIDLISYDVEVSAIMIETAA